MKKFASLEAANNYIISRVDRVVKKRIIRLKKGIVLSSSTIELGGGRFTNTYDISYDPANVTLNIGLSNNRISPYDIIGKNRSITVAMSGGFSYLTDDVEVRPRHQALNLAIENGEVKNLPVLDRETLLLINGITSVRILRAIGVMEIDGEKFDWSGSLSSHRAAIKVYGNGNSVIDHEIDGEGSSRRVLDEKSRFTPAILNSSEADVGFIFHEGGTFKSTKVSISGKLDIFAFDIVLRCPARLANLNIKMKVKTIDSLVVDTIQSGMSVGPLFSTPNFAKHPINDDASLGVNDPFSDRTAARAVLYETQDGLRHFRIFDGRPGSDLFVGVSPVDAVSMITSEHDVVWGCFLDGGQTAKLCVRQGLVIKSFGNKHYIVKSLNRKKILWAPEKGRSLASVVTLN